MTCVEGERPRVRLCCHRCGHHSYLPGDDEAMLGPDLAAGQALWYAVLFPLLLLMVEMKNSAPNQVHFIPGNSSVAVAKLKFHPSRLGPKANMENRSSPPPAISSLFKNLFGPISKAVTPSKSSASSSFPLFSGPLRRPSNSQRLFFADLTKAT